VRLKRLLALATQKFISELAADAFQYSKVRQGGGGASGAAGGPPGAAGGQVPGMIQIAGEGKKGGRNVLTLEDLGCAAGEYGVDVRRGEFYR
jgi:transcription initiation factor TFIID subunit 10